MGVQWVFPVIALALATASVVDYARSGSWTPRARIWRRLALVFLAVSLYLFWLNRSG